MAGLIALVQIDIKRVIAYSTMSQIGYMFVGAGIGAYSAAMFHLIDARLLQGAALPRRRHRHPRARAASRTSAGWAGSGKALPHTRIAFLVGALALVGIPPFAGFFSKDAIIAATLDTRRLRLLPLRRLPRRARS